jgi:hypothetical protein
MASRQREDANMVVTYSGRERQGAHRIDPSVTRRACNLYKMDQESGGRPSVENSIRGHDERLQATDT